MAAAWRRAARSSEPGYHREAASNLYENFERMARDHIILESTSSWRGADAATQTHGSRGVLNSEPRGCR